MEKIDEIKEISSQIQACSRCTIANQTPKKVIGKGSLSPKILFIGLNPGKEEIAQGIPFVGPSGKLLNKWINFLHLDQSNCAVTNIIKCYTPNQKGLDGTEADNCFPYLERQIQILQPDYIVALGDVAYRKLSKEVPRSISDVEGTFIPSLVGVDMFIMKHPSYYLRHGGKGWEEALQHLYEVIVPRKKTFGKSQQYVPLHCHSEYSITDGAGRIEDFVEHANKLGFESLALTDHGTLAGWFDFQQQCDKYGIKPILGVEFYVTTHYENKTKKRYHIVALAKNQEGIKNLFKLNTIAHTEGFYWKPRITVEDIIEHKEGLILLSACTLGVISQRILDGEMDEAYKVTEQLKEAFGEDFYIEFQCHYFPDQLVVNSVLLNMVNDLGIEPVITCDVHYKTSEQKEYHNAIKAISFNKKYGEGAFTGDTHCLLDSDVLEISALKTNITSDIVKRAQENTIKIAKDCNGRLEKYDTVIPKFEVPEDE